MAFEVYLEEARRALALLSSSQGASIAAAAGAIAAALEAGGVLHVFGCGHSHLLAEEAFFRAGGLAAVNPILDRRLMFFDGVMASTRAERESGYAARILEHEDVRAVDAAIVVSNSGRNAVPIEMALELRARGLKVIAVTSLAHAQADTTRHPSGKMLHEIADIVVDTGLPAGDAAITLPGSAVKMGPLSTVVGAAVVHAMGIEAAARLVQRGHDPLVLPSANLETTSQADLERTLRRYAGRVRYLDVPRDR
jgi:uncharacterized phosphosugar-binding protein